MAWTRKPSWGRSSKPATSCSSIVISPSCDACSTISWRGPTRHAPSARTRGAARWPSTRWGTASTRCSPSCKTASGSTPDRRARSPAQGPRRHRGMTDSLARELACIDCGTVHPLGYRLECEKCRGLLELRYDLDVLRARGPALLAGGGLWRDAPVLPIADPPHPGTLGEGGT